jgi:2-hydroxychromene-2-carboxylate isomerase
MDGPIGFYFDYISPYAYLAWTQIGALAARCGRVVEPVPVLFAALLNASGGVGPAEVPAKRRYVFLDTLRSAHVLKVPLQPPPTHPFNPLLALRVSSLPMANDERVRVVNALYAATWAGGGGVSEPERVVAALSSSGLDGAALVAGAAGEDAKARLRRQTDEAIARGTFGVPTLFVGDEMFWGYDSLPHLERFLRGELPGLSAHLQSWRDLPASAVRRRPGNS